ncbi:hypothetical protein Q8F55_001571 [Vanrija albida]|uniref:Tubby C-terminal domain-containing protein n=1 Tax=Vanrija albida TaxID=181172 RepID=A0ABR3QGD4_9TREE
MPVYDPHTVQLLAAVPSMGLYPPLEAHEPVTLYFRDKIFKAHDTDTGVRDSTGAVVLRVRDCAFSRRRRMDITDPEGSPLVTLRCKLATWLGHVVAQDAAGRWLLEARARPSWNGKHLDITYADCGGGERALTLRSDRAGRRADVLLPDGRVVMQLEHKVLGRDALGKNTDTWYLFIAPGVDTVLATTVCLAYDMYKEQQAARRG